MSESEPIMNLPPSVPMIKFIGRDGKEHLIKSKKLNVESVTALTPKNRTHILDHIYLLKEA